MSDDSTTDTMDHIRKVQARIAEIQANLDQRAAVHDRSKLAAPEKGAYDTLMVFRMSHDTPDYADRPTLSESARAHHYAVNSHHPQHYPNGIAGMSLLDLIEMLCDWKAAGERYTDGTITQSLHRNRARYSISDQLFAVLENTVKELGW